MNKLIRKFNNDIKEDWLWNGRFSARQVAATFKPFNDHSGALFTAIIELKDNKTGRTKQKPFDNYDINWSFWNWVNYCIADYWKIWKENPNPNQQARLEGREPS